MKPDRRVTNMLRTNGFFHDRDSAVVYDTEMVPHLKLEGKDRAYLRRRVWQKSRGKCALCRVLLRGNENWEMDHIRGGNSGRCDCIHNLQALCIPCHRAKHVQVRFGEGRKQAIRDFEKVMATSEDRSA